MMKWWETVINQLSPLALRYKCLWVCHVLIEWVDVFTVCWVYFYFFIFFLASSLVLYNIIQAPTKAEPSESEKEAKILAASQTKKEQKVSIQSLLCCVHVLHLPLCNSSSLLKSAQRPPQKNCLNLSSTQKPRKHQIL